MDSKTATFNQYKNMLYSTVWKYKKRYHFIDIDLLKSMAFEIFCIAFNNFDRNKSSFSTHLSFQLKRLNNENWCPKENYVNKNNYNLENFSWLISDKNYTQNLEKEEIKNFLSKDAKIILNYIESREWEKLNSSLIPSFHSVYSFFKKSNWTLKRVKKGWEELENWWKKYKNCF